MEQQRVHRRPAPRSTFRAGGPTWYITYVPREEEKEEECPLLEKLEIGGEGGRARATAQS